MDSHTSNVVRAVAEHWRIPAHVIRGRSRIRDVSQARRCVWWVLRKTTQMSYPEIGRQFERDHSTIVYGVNLFDHEVSTDPLVRRRAESITLDMGHPTILGQRACIEEEIERLELQISRLKRRLRRGDLMVAI